MNRFYNISFTLYMIFNKFSFVFDYTWNQATINLVMIKNNRDEKLYRISFFCFTNNCSYVKISLKSCDENASWNYSHKFNNYLKKKKTLMWFLVAQPVHVTSKIVASVKNTLFIEMSYFTLSHYASDVTVTSAFHCGHYEVIATEFWFICFSTTRWDTWTAQ